MQRARDFYIYIIELYWLYAGSSNARTYAYGQIIVVVKTLF